jgi:hypothetical protein
MDATRSRCRCPRYGILEHSDGSIVAGYKCVFTGRSRLLAPVYETCTSEFKPLVACCDSWHKQNDNAQLCSVLQYYTWNTKVFNYTFSAVFTEQVDELVTLQICTWEVLGSSLGQNTGYPDRYLWFYSIPQQKFRGSTSIRPRKLPSKFFLILYSPITIKFDALYCEIWQLHEIRN